MRTAIQTLALSLVLAGLTLTLVAPAPDARAGKEKGRYIVVFEDSVKRPARLALQQAKEQTIKIGFVYRYVLNGYSAELSAQAIDRLRRDPRVDYISVDGEVRTQETFIETITHEELEVSEATVPSGISRTFATSNETLDIDGLDDMRIDVDVAVIDTGTSHTHSDLNVVARTDCSNGTSLKAECVDESGADASGHGTHVAGTIAAIDNGIGVVGIAPGARIWAVKVLGTGTNHFSEIIAGVDWVTAKRKDGTPQNDIEVANLSLGCQCSSKPLDEAITKSVEAGVVHVVSAGNLSMDAKSFSPASSGNAITVSAIADYDGKAGGSSSATCGSYGLDDRLSSFSNFGTTIEVAAPGTCILSTIPGGYGLKSGTSMAAPHVAGAAALLAARNKPESKSEVSAIAETIRSKGNTGWTDTSGDGVKEPLLDVSDEAIFNAVGHFLMRDSNSEGTAGIDFTYQQASDVAVVGDWDKDGDSTAGVYRESERTFLLRNSNSTGSSDLAFGYGLQPATPIVGDWDGDGDTTVGLYDGENDFALNDANDSSGADYYFGFGEPGDIPLAGDWDGDGDTTIGVFRP